MVIYEFYLITEEEETDLIGILPERRKNPERITEESIMKWGKEVVGDKEDINKIYYIPVEL